MKQNFIVLDIQVNNLLTNMYNIKDPVKAEEKRIQILEVIKSSGWNIDDYLRIVFFGVRN